MDCWTQNHVRFNRHVLSQQSPNLTGPSEPKSCRGDCHRRRSSREHLAKASGIKLPLDEVKQLSRFFSSDVVDGEGVLAKLLVFLECSDSYYYIDKE